MANIFAPGIVGLIAAAEFVQDVCGVVDNVNNIVSTAKFFYDVFTPEPTKMIIQPAQNPMQQIPVFTEIGSYRFDQKLYAPVFVDTKNPPISILNPRHPSHPSHPSNSFPLESRPLQKFEPFPHAEPDGPKVQWLADHERRKMERNFR